MTSRDEERARILAACTDDLLADREPTITAEAATLFTPEELAEALSTVRFFKGLLRPSRLDPGVEASMRVRLVERARAAAIAASPGVPLPALLAERRHAAGLSISALAAHAGLAERELEGLEADSIPFNTISPERLLDLATALAIPGRELLRAAQLAAERWLPRLARRGLQPGLAGFRATTGMAAAADRESARAEAAEALADYLARLERLAGERGMV